MRSILSLFTAACLLSLSATAVRGDNEELPSKYKKASDIVGQRVVNTTGENLGKIEEIVLDARTGRIAYAVLSFGGFLGIGDKLFAIPWQALREDPVKKVCVLPVDKEKLKTAPGFDKENWPDMAEPRFREEVYRFYGIPLTAAEGWGAGARSFEEGTIENLRKEPVELPLKLTKGTKLSYQFESSYHGRGEQGAGRVPDEQPQERPRKADAPPPGRDEGRSTEAAGASATGPGLVRLEITEMSGGEAKVEVTCSGKETKTATLTVTQDGAVQYEGATTQEDTGKEAHFRAFMAHIFGQGLHGRRLEPGREYTMPGSLHNLRWTEGHGESRTEGSAGATATAGSHAMRFEGLTRKQGMELAIFSLPASGSGFAPAGSRQTESGTTGGTAGQQGSTAAGTRPATETAGVFGRAAYRVDDGLLEKLVFDGMTVRRLDMREASPGN
jgi:sporulation protein YlmC with PRC-barrel domain